MCYRDTLWLEDILTDHAPDVRGWTIAQWESARPNLDLPKMEARSEVSA